MRAAIDRAVCLGACIGALAAVLAITAPTAAGAGTGGYLRPLVPARLADTRAGGSTADGAGPHGRLDAGDTVPIQVAGRAGIAGDASAVALNVTADVAGGTGYLTVFPCDGAPPNASNVNVLAGDTVPNAVLAKLDDAGRVCVFTSVATELIVDVAGWFPAAGSGYHALRPARLADTRPGAATVDMDISAVGALVAGEVLPVAVAGRGGVPIDGAGSVAVNVTAVDPSAAGYLTVYPCGGTPPNASNVNFRAGQTIANQVLVPLAAGQLCVFTSAPAHVLVDVAGYFADGAPSFRGLAPVRLADTREGGRTIDSEAQGSGALSAGGELAVRVLGRGGVQLSDGAVALNVTAVDMQDAGYLTVYPCGQEPPNASNVNYVAGQTIANSVTVKVGAGGAVCVFTYAAGHVLVDVAGAFPTGSTVGAAAAVQVAAGFGHTCGLRSGQVRCWGANGAGQLGDGTFDDSPVPVGVVGLGAVTAITAGSRHACALGADGRVRCWGANDLGQLGDGTTTDRSSPVTVGGLVEVTAIGAGTDHTCAVFDGGRVACWGANDDDELLTGDGAPSPTPVNISALGDDIVTVAGGGSHTCAVRASGAVVCWGANYFGQVGGGFLEPETGSADVVGLPADAVDISAGWVHSCAVLTDGSVWCWGNGDAGQFGNGQSSTGGDARIDQPAPVQMAGVSDAVEVAAGVGHTCVVLADGTARCSGINAAGELGDGTQLNRVLPVAVLGVGTATSVAAVADGEHACVTELDGSLRCWGRNAEGQLGNTDVGSVAETAVPVEQW